MTEIVKNEVFVYDETKESKKGSVKGFEVWLKGDEENKEFYSKSQFKKIFKEPSEDGDMSKRFEEIKEFKLKHGIVRKTYLIKDVGPIDVLVVSSVKPYISDVAGAKMINMSTVMESELYSDSPLEEIKFKNFSFKLEHLIGNLGE